MKSSKNIVFLGMMGSGKTSIGFLISRKLKLDFFDIDNHIENNFGMKISEPCVISVTFRINSSASSIVIVNSLK